MVIFVQKSTNLIELNLIVKNGNLKPNFEVKFKNMFNLFPNFLKFLNQNDKNETKISKNLVKKKPKIQKV